MSSLALGVLPVGVVKAEGFIPPSIDEFFPKAFLFQGTPFEMNRIVLVRLIVCLALLVIGILYNRRAKLVPGKAQGTLEYLLDFCRDNLSIEILGEKYGMKYNPLITAIFFSVLFLNLAGIIPGLNLAGTAVSGVPLLLAIFSWFLFIFAGIGRNGVGGFFKSSLFPPGVPKLLYLLLTPIEFISTFIIRPFTLFVRLLANMIAGHMLLALTLLATNFFVFAAGTGLKPFAILTILVAFAFTLFELLVAFLQAYIFAILTAVYLDLSVHPAH